jgi:GTP-binding protein
LTEENILENYLKIRKELLSYDAILAKKKEIIIFNKSDLFKKKDIEVKLKKFKSKIKKKIEIISVFSKEDLQKIKKLLLKNVTR